MVGMQMSFGSADFATPHGGPPFQGWRKGFGFGHAKGPGNHVLDPASPCQLRVTPAGDRAYSSTPFWRGKWELGQASSFGVGDRPTYGKGAKDCSIAPDNYGDVSKVLTHTKKNACRPGITMKPKYPSIEEKKRDLSWPTAGPGPAKYNTSIPAGQSSWVHPARNPSWTCAPRGIISSDLKDKLSQPGPTEYSCITKPGTNSPILRGTLYDISMKGRSKPSDGAGDLSPGPARYNLKGAGGTMPKHGKPLDEYGLWEKISNCKDKADYRTFRPKVSASEELYQDELRQENASSPLTQQSPQRTLTRVESSPV